jgi:hypothetical protein
LLLSLWNTQSIASQKLPVFSIVFLLHDDFNGVKSVISLGLGRNDFSEQNQIKMIMTTILDGEVNNDPVILELDMEIIFVFNGVGNFDTNFGGSLIPSVSDLEVMTNEFFFGHIFFSELDDGASRDSFELGLLNSGQKVSHEIGL